jgi:hypothetical protein
MPGHQRLLQDPCDLSVLRCCGLVTGGGGGAALAREAPFAATYRDAFQHTRSEEWMT